MNSPIEIRRVTPRARWYGVFCRATGEPYGGWFTENEAAFLERSTAGLEYTLTAVEFGHHAAAAVEWGKNNQ